MKASGKKDKKKFTTIDGIGITTDTFHPEADCHSSFGIYAESIYLSN